MVALTACATTGGEEEVVDIDSADQAIEFKFPLREYKRISRGYKGRHRGVDISAERNTPIYAAESGWVTYQGRKFHGYGKLVIVEHSKAWATFYAHMNDFAVKEGQWVKKGDVIGYVGSTGRSTGTHLHLEIRYKNKPIDPAPYFSQTQMKLAHQ
jgi:murein DD-endopeptidase MepM/ murein hydrolase activator NlpD